MNFPDTPFPSVFSGLDNLATGVLVVDPAGVVRYLNAAGENLLGVSGTLLIGEAYFQLFERSPELHGALQSARQSRETVTEHDMEITLSGHTPVRVSCTLSYVEGALEGWLLELRPVDAQLRIARHEQIRMQQEANRELLRNLAHEIKNPLGGIRGAAQLLERELPRESLKDYTQVIIKESDRLQSLMERLLTPRRLPHFSAVNIHEVLERVRSLLLAETPEGIVIQRDYDLSLTELEADPEQLIQAALNIARNAVQAMHGQGRLIFRSRVARQMHLGSRRLKLAVRVDIIDNGPGIPEAIREQIFFPLVSGREGGSGLGLPLAQTLVAQNYGMIECESEPGNTVFSIYLPLQA